MDELAQKEGNTNGDDQHLDEGKGNHLAVDETFPVRIHEERAEEHHGQRGRHAADHTDGLGQYIGKLDISQIEDDSQDAGPHARIQQAAQAKRFGIAAAAFDGLDDIREEQEVKGNEQDGHVNEGIFTINPVDHGHTHEADIGKDDHDIDEAPLGLGIMEITATSGQRI